jgi:ABC-2 family transporter protein
MIWSIIRKDLQQHRRNVLIFAAVGTVLSVTGKVVVNHQDLSAGIHRFLFTYITVVIPMELTMWFVGQEKLKETIRVLRLLPVTPAQFVTAKMLAIVLLGEVFFFGSTLIQTAVKAVQEHSFVMPWNMFMFTPIPFLMTAVLVPVYLRFHYKFAGMISLVIYLGLFSVGEALLQVTPTQGVQANAFLSLLGFWAFVAFISTTGWVLARRFYSRTEEVSTLIDD